MSITGEEEDDNSHLGEEDTEGGKGSSVLEEGDDLEARLAARWHYYSKVLQGLLKNPATVNTTSPFLPPPNAAVANLTIDLSSLVRRRDDPGRTAILLLAYSLVICISLFGNLLVCHVVLRTRRLHTPTNIFLANLALSDLLMTALNIPFNVARVLLKDWPFGSAMCKLVPFVQVTSVYVSTLTMVAIALDRYQVTVHPLKPRLGRLQGAVIILTVWLLAALASLPYALYSQVVEVFTYRRLTRCQARYPSPAREFRQWLTLATFLTQYVAPLCITAVAYVGVTRRVRWRAVVGAATREQLSLHFRAKKKTVKMLMIVVVVFALSWLPLNAYHLVVDFSPNLGPGRHSSTIFFICHWFAMSNVCYNPFIYCWLNDHFRAGARAWLLCTARKFCHVTFTEDETGKEPRGIPLPRPRDSVTLSSSALTSGSLKSKMNGLQLSNKSNTTPSDFDVALDDVVVSSAIHKQQRGSSNSTPSSGKQRQRGNSGPDDTNYKYEEAETPPAANTVMTSCTHSDISADAAMTQVEEEPPRVGLKLPNHSITDIDVLAAEEHVTLPGPVEEKDRTTEDKWDNDEEKDVFEVTRKEGSFTVKKMTLETGDLLERLPRPFSLLPISEESPNALSSSQPSDSHSVKSSTSCLSFPLFTQAAPSQ